MDMIRVNSSAISAIGYDPASLRMQIRFQQGHTYTYCRVPQSVFDGLLRASSKGTYYDRHIKDRYQC
jgi:hypothetical protein